MIENLILQYLKPELLVLIPVLYLIGLGLKKAAFIKDNYIPLILGAIGILVVFFYLLGVSGWNINLIWISIAQGILVAGGSVYINNIYKQLIVKK